MYTVLRLIDAYIYIYMHITIRYPFWWEHHFGYEHACHEIFLEIICSHHTWIDIFLYFALLFLTLKKLCLCWPNFGVMSSVFYVIIHMIKYFLNFEAYPLTSTYTAEYCSITTRDFNIPLKDRWHNTNSLEIIEDYHSMHLQQPMCL